MAKIDEIKEILNTLRLALSILMGILIITIGSVINRFDNNKVDDIFWFSIVFAFIIIIILTMIIKKISNRTKEIKDL